MESLNLDIQSKEDHDKLRIWKRDVDDTFTALDRGSVDSFLQYLNNQEPSIRFTMETESSRSSPSLTAQFQESQTDASPHAVLSSVFTIALSAL